MTIKIFKDHWCANCRLMYDSWRVRSSASAKIALGGTWPIGMAIPEKVTNKCPACEHVMVGKLHTKEDEATDLFYLLDVAEAS